MPWWDAMRSAKVNRFLGKTDWRPPTKAEGESIVGKFDDCIRTQPRRAVSTAFQPVAQDNLSWFWTSSPYAGNASGAWFVNFYDGGINDDLRVNSYHVRLVRSGQSSAFSEFNREFAKIGQYEAAHLAEKRKEEREAAAKAQQERAQAAANAANEARRNAEACGRLYAGKPVKIYAGKVWGMDFWVNAMVTGVGNGVASARVTGGDTRSGYEVGSIHEKNCNEF